MDKLKINPFRLVFYLLISGVSLITGVYGIHLLSVKADLPFKYEEKNNCITAATAFEDIKNGDTLYSINSLPVNRTHQVEFIIDRLETGNNVELLMSANGRRLARQVMLAPAYPDNVFIIVSALTGLAFWIIALFLLLKKPDEREARILSYLLILLAVATVTSPGKFSGDPSIAEYYVRSVHFLGYALGIGLYLHFALIFPVDRCGGNKLILKIIYSFFLTFSALLIFFQSYAIKSNELYIQNILHIIWICLLLLLFVCILAGIVIFFISFFTAKSGHERKKAQWVIWGVCAGALPYIALWVLPTLLGLNTVLREEFTLVFLIIIPVSFSIGIIKHQLFDIDVIFSRSLVYTIMSIALILIYIVVNLSFSVILNEIIGYSHVVMSVIASVFFALIFSPLKIRVQITVDRIFYRQKYDFGVAVKQFVDKLKNYDSVDLLSNLVVKEFDFIIPVTSLAIVSINSTERKINLLSHKNFPFMDNDTVNQKCNFLFSSFYQPIALTDSVEQEADIYITMSDEIKKCGIKLIVPIQTETEEIKGAVMFGNKLSGRKFTLLDIELLKTLTTNVALIMRRMELQEQLIAKEIEKQKRDEEGRKALREMRIAKEVQQKLFPHAAPEIDSADYFGICHSAEYVGGDYYDYFLLGTDKLAVAIGDVSGHGLSSALMMAGITASIRSKAPLYDNDITGLIDDLNKYLCETTTDGKFLTLFYAIFDIRRKSLKYINAGHIPPLLFRHSQNEFTELIEGGLMLGMIDDIKFEEKEIVLEKNDLIVMVTDGITEAMNKESKMWGLVRLKEVIRANPYLSSEELSDTIINEVRKFTDGLPQDDDITIITFRVN